MTSTEPVHTFPFRVTTPGQALERYSQLRGEEPATRVRLPGGHTGWLLTRYDDVRTALTDPRFSKQAATAPDAPRILPVHRGAKTLVTLDPPDHTRLRRLVSGEFTHRRVGTLRPQLEQLTGQLLDAMLTAEDGTADVLTALALPLPIGVICRMLGIPAQDQDDFRQWSDGILAVAGGVPGDEASAARARDGVQSLMGYLGRLTASKRLNPDDDLLTRLLQAEEEDALSAEEVCTFGMTLLVAGYHTTAAAIAHMLLHLLEDPSRYDQLLADPGLIPGAVEEALRYSQVAAGFGSLRIALSDVPMGDVVIRAGEPVIPLINSANRDPEVFEDPDDVRLDRHPNHHLAFGAGIHFCLGAPLARLELQVLLEILVQRGIKLRLAEPVDGIDWHLATAFPRPRRLTVHW